MSESAPNLMIGWASRDVTPTGKVSLCGQFHIRLTEEVHDPLTVTAVGPEGGQQVVEATVAAINELFSDENG